MPRIKASPKKCVKTSNSQQGANTWVFLLKGEVPEGTPDVVQLRHPQSGSPAMFLFSPGDGMVQEVLTFSENRSRSWFIDDSVKSDGKMHLSTPIDPVFLVLPYLRKVSHAMPLDQLLKDDDFPETERLLRSTGLKHLSQVADRKGDEDLNAYKYNEEKALSWLQRKTERVAEVLKQKGVHVSSGAVSATFVKGKQDGSPEDSQSYLKYAHGIVSEYLTDDLSSKLLQHMGLPEESSSSKRKLTVSQSATPSEKKLKPEEVANGGVLDLTKPEKAAKTSITSKDKARAKSAVGSKNISSFFKKKNTDPVCVRPYMEWLGIEPQPVVRGATNLKHLTSAGFDPGFHDLDHYYFIQIATQFDITKAEWINPPVGFELQPVAGIEAGITRLEVSL